MKAHALKITPTALAVLILLTGQAHAVGTGTVASGTGSISKDGSTTTVTQGSDKLIINWDNMDVAKGETLTFNQKDIKSFVLNRIASSSTATSILGALNANGRVFIVNPNGVVIGNGAKINVGSLIASSINITDRWFNTDSRLIFTGGGGGDVTNAGEITATESVYLFSTGIVGNSGTINGYKAVELASASHVMGTYDPSGLGFAFSYQSGNSSRGLVTNSGVLKTTDGSVTLAASINDANTRTVINNTGTIEANKLASGEAGKVTLLNGNTGTTNVDGTIKAATGVYVSGGSVTQNKGARIDSDTVEFTAKTGTVTLSGETYGTSSVTIDSQNANLDGTIETQNLKVSATETATTTDNAKLTVTETAALNGGAYDFSLGVNAFRNTKLAVNSIKLSLNGESIVEGTVVGDALIRGNNKLQLQKLSVGGKLDASAIDDLVFTSLLVDGDIVLHGKNVTATKPANGSGIEDAIQTDGNVTVTADESIKLGMIETKGDIRLSADKDVTTGDLYGKSIEVKAKSGKLYTEVIQSDEDAYLEGGSSIVLNGRATTGKNLTLVSQGDITQEDGVEVGGDLEYKISKSSKVSSKGHANVVKGRTIGLNDSGGSDNDDDNGGGNNGGGDNGGGDNGGGDNGGGDNGGGDNGGGDNGGGDNGGGDNGSGDNGGGGNDQDGNTPPEQNADGANDAKSKTEEMMRKVEEEARRRPSEVAKLKADEDKRKAEEALRKVESMDYAKLVQELNRQLTNLLNLPDR
ncbi:filamentous hemagglutinin N-terminal domain-containing protein [Trinickia sp. YCB016]